MYYARVFKNTYYQVLARILSSGSGFLISILLAQSFGVALYGDYIKITSYIALFYLFCDFGINAIFIQRKDNDQSFRNLLYLRLGVALVVFILANLIALLLPYNSQIQVGFSSFVKLGIFIFSIELFIQSLLFSVHAIFQKKMRFDFWTKAELVGALVSLGLVYFGVQAHQSLYFILGALIVSDLVKASIALFYTGAKILPPGLNIKIAKSLFLESFPLGMMLVFNLIYFRVDSLILAAFQSSKDVGIYGLSYQLFDFLLAMPLFISNSVYPILIKEKDNPEKFFNLVRSYTGVYLGVSLLVVIIFWFVSPLVTLVGPDFSVVQNPFKILLLGLPFFFLTSLYQWVLITLKKTKFLMITYFLLMCGNIILNFIFIPKYSYIGAAWVTVVCEFFVFIAFFARIFIRRYA